MSNTTTEKQSFTAGPWKLLPLPTRKEQFAVVTTNDAPIQAVICLMDGRSKACDVVNLEANARLIAASPFLLEACQSALIALKQDSLAWRQAAITDLEAAIAKATEEP